MNKQKNSTDSSFDEVSFIMEYKGGDLGYDETVDGFQHLIDSGLVWKLQGSYGRTAHALIEDGVCHAV